MSQQKGETDGMFHVEAADDDSRTYLVTKSK
jgi:hypothetical protein